MIYPSFLGKNGTIGISAPSAGVGRKLEDFDRSLATLRRKGYRIVETASVRINDMRGGSAEERAEELVSLFKNDDVDFVMAAAGGDFLFEILPYTDFRTMKKHPKWLMGASDPTGILFPYTTKYDVATIYGCNAGSYDVSPLPKFLKDNLKIISGDLPVQTSYKKYMKTPGFLAEKIEYDTPVKWLGTVDSLHTQGRCIGGCIDVLKDLIGTRFDGAKDFVRRYKNDGIIWYFDNFSMGAEIFYRTLLQMRYAGWFSHTKAVLVGRVLFESSDTGMTYGDALSLALPDISVLYQADIGHTIPSMTMINGAILNIDYENHKSALTFSLK
ncbi:MAG: LD-carboxypeptidase [Erysipelotrichaceae bacterium]|nr:LD-carboxypeptidase [Erysipelotrichaceae bacterium]